MSSTVILKNCTTCSHLAGTVSYHIVHQASPENKLVNQSINQTPQAQKLQKTVLTPKKVFRTVFRRSPGIRGFDAPVKKHLRTPILFILGLIK
jgi:hypothetical protein